MSQKADPAASLRPGTQDPASQATGGTAPVVAVPVLSLYPADSPRLNGEDKAHIARLAEIETPLPPILVDRRTLRVIDGMHRLMAASLQGRETIDVKFFDGSEADVFLHAVQENVAHGLPLSQADRRAAAERIIASHPHMSDRSIGHLVGLAAKTVAAVRAKTSVEGSSGKNARVGRDGRVRPLDSGTGRRRAADLLSLHPDASLRDVARVAGISPATVLDVRKRLERGQSPVPEKFAANVDRKNVGDNGGEAATSSDDDSAQAIRSSSRGTVPPDPAVTVEKLLRDPSLRNERSMGMLRVLHVNAVAAEQLPAAVSAVPPHCLGVVVQLACHYAQMWQDFAFELDGRARIVDPVAAMR